MKTYHSIIDPAIALLAESNGTRSEQYSSTEFSATVEYHGPWLNRNAVINALRDTVFPVTVENLGPYYSYYQPASVQSISVSPVGLEGVHINSDFHTPYQPYTMAKYSVQYKGLARPGNSSIQEQVTPNIQMRQMPSFGCYWYSDGAPVLDREAPAIRESHLTINRTITGVRMLPDFFFALAGCVNSNTWQDSILGKIFLPGTLLYTPANLDRQMTFANDNDDYLWTFSYSLEWNPIGWNNFQRPHAVDTMMYSVPKVETKEENGEEVQEITGWEGVPIQMFPPAFFPTMIFDPNYTDGTEWVMNPFRVTGVDYDGVPYCAYVDALGNVEAVKGEWCSETTPLPPYFGPAEEE